MIINVASQEDLNKKLDKIKGGVVEGNVEFDGEVFVNYHPNAMTIGRDVTVTGDVSLTGVTDVFQLSVHNPIAGRTEQNAGALGTVTLSQNNVTVNAGATGKVTLPFDTLEGTRKPLAIAGYNFSVATVSVGRIFINSSNQLSLTFYNPTTVPITTNVSVYILYEVIDPYYINPITDEPITE